MTGRPKKFKSLDEMVPVAEVYFASTPKEEWTVTGLALALDTTRELLVDYEKDDAFSDAIKKWKAMVENSYELSLRKNGRTGDIFALKNFGWKDKQDVESTNVNVDATDSLDEEQKKKIAKLYGS